MTLARRARPDLSLALLAAVLAVAGPLHGQTYEQVAPKPVRATPPPPPTQPAAAAPAPVADPNQILVPELTGLRLIPSAEQVSKAALPAGQPLAIEDLPWLNQTRVVAIANQYLSHPLTRGGLAHLVQALVLLARGSDRPVVDVYAPPQDVSSGVVQLVVFVGKLGKVRVENNKWFAAPLLTRDVRLKPGQDITSQSLLEDMDLLNQNPFRQVNLVYARGDQPGQTDVLLDVNDVRPERVYTGYEDTGNEATGLGRVYGGFNLGDFLSDDQQVNYQYTRSTDWHRLQADSGSYVAPLPWRDTIDLFGSWAQAESVTGGLFDLTGITWQIGARYTIPLPMVHTYTQSLTLGTDYKWSNNDLAFGGTQVFSSPASIVQGVVGYNGSKTDDHGSTQGSITAFVSPGGIGGLNRDSDFIVQRAGATANYQYYQASLGRVEKLPDNFTLVLSTLGQFSSARLLPSEQFGLGGATSVRGYDERIVNGDDGISGQLELRTPTRHLLDKIPDQTQALVFIDAGRDWQRDPQPGETDNTLASAGPGLRMSISTHGTIKADYGWQLERLTGTRRSRLHLSAVFSY